MEVLLSTGGFTWDGERPPKQQKLPTVVCLYPRPAMGEAALGYGVVRIPPPAGSGRAANNLVA